MMEQNKNQYNKYHFKKTEYAISFLQCMALCLLMNYLFYQIVWLNLLVFPLYVGFINVKRKQRIKKRRKDLNYQFKDALNSMNVAIQAGYSVENAIAVCFRDLSQIYPENADILQELRYMEARRRMSVPIEELFLDFADRCRIEDVQNFASVFMVAKRTGGDMGLVFQKVSRMLTDKIEVNKEIEATLASKKWEQIVMTTMPVGIILYMKLSSPGFLDILYGNAIGIGAMTICLVIYLTAIWMGNKIVDIEV
ncbi:MAG: pilus assembly protein TadB [Eubacteriales bacterium]|nr:pilus assembly protein TadB [Eubacteriales bacterium]